MIQLFAALISQRRCKHQSRYSRSKPCIPVSKSCRKCKPKP